MPSVLSASTAERLRYPKRAHPGNGQVFLYRRVLSRGANTWPSRALPEATGKRVAHCPPPRRRLALGEGDAGDRRFAPFDMPDTAEVVCRTIYFPRVMFSKNIYRIFN